MSHLGSQEAVDNGICNPLARVPNTLEDKGRAERKEVFWVSLITALLITGLDWNHKICFYMPGGHRVSLKPCSETNYAPRKCVILGHTSFMIHVIRYTVRIQRCPEWLVEWNLDLITLKGESQTLAKGDPSTSRFNLLLLLLQFKSIVLGLSVQPSGHVFCHFSALSCVTSKVLSSQDEHSYLEGIF